MAVPQELMQGFVQALAEQNRVLSEQLRAASEQQAAITQAMLGQLMGAFREAGNAGAARGPGGGSSSGLLDGRLFKDLGYFDGNEPMWKEWSMKYKAAVRECSQEAFDVMTWAENESDELTEEAVRDSEGEDGVRIGVALYNRLLRDLKGEAWQHTQGTGSGLEVWRSLARRCQPNTPMRGIQLMVRITNPPRITKGRTSRRRSGDGRTTSSRWRATTTRCRTR